MNDIIYNLRFGLPPKTDMKFLKNLAEAYKLGYEKLSDKSFDENVTSSTENSYLDKVELMMNETKIELSKWLNKKTDYKFNYLPENLLLVDGCSEAIIILMRIIFSKKAKVLIEAPSYHKYIKYFENEGYELFPIKRCEESGNFNMEEIKLFLKNNQIDFFYFIPTCSNPPGQNIDLKQKIELVNLSKQYNFFIIADDIYEYLTPDIQHIPTSFCNNDLQNKEFNEKNVISINSFNKLFNINGTRFGWIHASKDIIISISENLRKVNTDLMPSNLDYFRYYCYQFYINTTINDLYIYTINSLTFKRNEVSKLLKKCEYCNFNIPKAGYFLWIKLSEIISLEDLKLNLEKKKILVQFGENFVGKNFIEKYKFDYLRYRIRISIGTLPIDKLIKGVKILIDCINMSIKDKSKF